MMSDNSLVFCLLLQLLLPTQFHITEDWNIHISWCLRTNTRRGYLTYAYELTGICLNSSLLQSELGI